MNQKRVLAVGSMALDTIKTPFGSVKDALGGSATYFSAGARFFGPVSVVAVVGSDFPKKHLTLLKKLGVDTSGVTVEAGRTFRWSGEYQFDLNTAITKKTELNVFASFKPDLLPVHRKSPYLFLANIDPEIQASVLRQVENPRFTACDTMNYWIGNKKKSLLALLKKVDIFLCNDSEARELTGEYSLIGAARWILSRGPKLLIIKKGEHGVLGFSKDFVCALPAFLLEKVYDPTGAGDTFAGGFVGYLASCGKLNESSVRQAIVYGSVLASYNVESFSLRRVAELKSREVALRCKAFKALTNS